VMGPMSAVDTEGNVVHVISVDDDDSILAVHGSTVTPSTAATTGPPTPPTALSCARERLRNPSYLSIHQPHAFDTAKFETDIGVSLTADARTLFSMSDLSRYYKKRYGHLSAEILIRSFPIECRCIHQDGHFHN
jgi:hypothetical protein